MFFASWTLSANGGDVAETAGLKGRCRPEAALPPKQGLISKVDLHKQKWIRRMAHRGLGVSQVDWEQGNFAALSPYQF
jgi:uncharacterized protein YfiM (DUF2279 family)